MSENPEKKRFGGYQALWERYDIPKGTGYSMVSKKQIPHIKLNNRHVKFDFDELDRWFDAHRVKPTKSESK